MYVVRGECHILVTNGVQYLRSFPKLIQVVICIPYYSCTFHIHTRYANQGEALNIIHLSTRRIAYSLFSNPKIPRKGNRVKQDVKTRNARVGRSFTVFCKQKAGQPFYEQDSFRRQLAPPGKQSSRGVQLAGQRREVCIQPGTALHLYIVRPKRKWRCQGMTICQSCESRCFPNRDSMEQAVH